MDQLARCPASSANGGVSSGDCARARRKGYQANLGTVEFNRSAQRSRQYDVAERGRCRTIDSVAGVAVHAQVSAVDVKNIRSGPNAQVGIGRWRSSRSGGDGVSSNGLPQLHQECLIVEDLRFKDDVGFFE